MLPTASVQSANQASAAEPAHPVDKFDEYEDAEKNFQPKSLKFWTIIIGMYLSIFLVALVSSLQETAAPGLGPSRIEPLLRLPFHASPTNSTRSRISAGMVVPTC